MISLIRSEIRRLTSRRLARIVALILVGIALLTLGRVFFVASKDPGPELARATVQAAEERVNCENAKASDPSADFDCASIKPSHFFADPRVHAVDALPDGTRAVAVTVAIVAFLVGASYVGADWAAGTMQALLFWEPRRWRVLVAKAVALVLVCVAFLAAFEALVYAGTLGLAATRGTFDGVTSGLHVSNALVALRGGMLVSICALLGFAVAGLARHSGASLGVGFVYFVIVENLIRGLRPGWQRFLLFENFNAILSKRMEVAAASAKELYSGGFEGGVARFYVLTGTRGAITLGVYLAILLGAFYLAFSRRDVT